MPFDPKPGAMDEPRNSSSIDVDTRVVDVATRGRHAPRVPETPERKRLEGQRSVRQLVFGVQDGVLTSLGIATGVGIATDRATVLLTGALSLLVGSISMGVGEYLGNKAEREVVQNAIDVEQREMLEKPAEEFAEQLAYYRLKGFTDDEAMIIVSRLSKNPDIWLHEMVRDEFGVDLRAADPPGLSAPFVMGGSFGLGHLLPLLPYVFLPLASAMWFCLAFATGTLFTIGAVAGKLGGRHPLLKGLEIVGYGAAVFVISYLAGHYIPGMFGLHPVAVGG